MLIISNLTNINLLTIERHYTLTGSSAFLHFEASEAQHIGTANTEVHHQREKPLIFKDFRSIFNDKKKTVDRYDCINLLFLFWRRMGDSNPRARKGKRFSRPPRYDHFDNPPSLTTLL